jgi:dihydrolipoamide dehydrogenase
MSDLVVLGGGPGGYATALRALGHGLSVTLVEADAVGGTCLHRGCVPSKALLHVAAVRDEVARLSGNAAAWDVDVSTLHRVRDDTVSTLHRGLQSLITSRGGRIVAARGRISGPGVVQLDDGSTLTGRHVVIATGSLPRALPGVAVDGDVVITSDDAVRCKKVPRSALVVGAGAIGMEFASLWRSLGAEVTVVEALDRLLPSEDESSSAFVRRAFSKRGIDVRVSTDVGAITCHDGSARVDLSDGSSVTVEQVLLATGRAPNTSDIGARELGLLDAAGYVEADDHCRTEVDRIWAVGDVLPTLALAHAAFAEGFLVADTVAGLDVTPIRYEFIPRVTYSRPEVASVGLTETAARDRYPDPRVTVTSLGGNARAIIEGDGGQVKVIAAADGTVLGVHLVGPSATELIGEASLAIVWGALVGEVAEVVHAHPTLHESLRETFLVAAGQRFHAH